MSSHKNIEIIHKTDQFLALNKPAGLLVHPTEKGNKETLTDILLQDYPEIRSVGDRPDLRPGIVHRLDQDTSGILIIARTQKFFDYFKKLLKKRKVNKTYLALVWGNISEKGRVEKPIGLKPNTTRRTTQGKNLKMVKDALTEYRPLENFKKFTLMELYPKTGRTHQLRVHMASIHHSIVGDRMYGKKEDPFNLGRQFLHAHSIEFSTEEGERIKLEAPLPKDLQDILTKLKN